MLRRLNCGLLPKSLQNRKSIFILPLRFIWNNCLVVAAVLVTVTWFYINFDPTETYSRYETYLKRGLDTGERTSSAQVNALPQLKDTPYPGVHQHIRYSVAHFGLKPLTDVEPLKPDFGDVIHDVTSFKYPITIPPCQGVPTNRSIFIAVISAPGYFDKRDLIRKTWMKTFQSIHKKGLLQIVGFGFIVGMTGKDTIQREIEEESRIYGDIIQIDMIDTYRSLATKVVGLLNWVNKYCSSNIDFVLKVDDDVFVNARNVLMFLTGNGHQPNKNIYITKFNDWPPHRDGKWAISYEQWPWKNFPNFGSGGSVLMPKDIIFPLLAAAQTTPLLPFEDVYLIGLCVEKAEIAIQSSPSILTRGMSLIPDACRLRTSMTWLTESNTHMNNSQSATENFYTNRTQCVKKKKKKVISTIDFEAPVQFDFTTRTKKKTSKSSQNKIGVRLR